MSSAYIHFLGLLAARTLIVLITLAVGLRLFGKRQTAQMNIYDLAMIMCIANAVQNAMTSGKGSISVGMVSAGTLLLAGWGMTKLFVRAPGIESRFVGAPAALINDGKLLGDTMRRERVTEEELFAALRAYGIDDPAKVRMAVLEVDGSISVVTKDERSAGR